MSKYRELIYLAGAMETVADAGLSWREEYKEELDQFLEADVIIPGEHEGKIVDKYLGEDTEGLSNQERINNLKKTYIKTYVEIMRDFIEFDLKRIDDCDLVICRWNGERTAGTIGEVQHCYLFGKPVYLILGPDVKEEEVPGWFLACFTEVFDTLGCCIGHLAQKKWENK